MARKNKIKDLFLLLAGLIGVIGFFMFLLSPLTRLAQTALGKNVALSYEQVYFGKNLEISGSTLQVNKGAIGPFIAFIVALLIAIYYFVAGFSKLKKNKILGFIVFILGIACSVIMFLTKTFFVNANNLSAIAESYQLGVGAILGGILTAISTLFGGYALLITKK